MRQAAITDFEQIASFYKYVIDNTKNMEIYARWAYGQHPTDEMIMGFVCKSGFPKTEYWKEND